MPQVLITPVAEAAEIPRLREWTVDQIKEEATAQAKAHRLNTEHFLTVMELESSGWKNIQSQVPDSKGPNGLENSWGICQINLTAHPEITQDQALDPHFCLQWSAEEWAAGYAWLWTEWRQTYGR